VDIFLIINYTSSFYFENFRKKVDFQFSLKLNYKNKMKQILISSVLMVVLCIQLTKAEEKKSWTLYFLWNQVWREEKLKSKNVLKDNGNFFSKLFF